MKKAPQPTGLLIPPYGGPLVDLVVADDTRGDLMQRASRLPAVQLSAPSRCALELLTVGAFSPLDRFMGEVDYRRVLEDMRLADGTPFPIPVTLPANLPEGTGVGSEILLRSPSNEPMAMMVVEEIFER